MLADQLDVAAVPVQVQLADEGAEAAGGERCRGK
jgi:hypothetical protein